MKLNPDAIKQMSTWGLGIVVLMQLKGQAGTPYDWAVLVACVGTLAARFVSLRR